MSAVSWAMRLALLSLLAAGAVAVAQGGRESVLKHVHAADNLLKDAGLALVHCEITADMNSAVVCDHAH